MQPVPLPDDALHEIWSSNWLIDFRDIFEKCEGMTMLTMAGRLDNGPLHTNTSLGPLAQVS